MRPGWTTWAMGSVALGLGVAAAGHAATPDVVETRSAQGDVALTIYNGMALIEDVRRIELPKGLSRQEFPDVSAQIRPETVTISAPGAAVVEQNFDYDLLTPSALLDKSVGQDVSVVRLGPDGKEVATTAHVLANNQGAVVQVGNRIEVLREMPGRVVYSGLPAGLRARPTLSVTLDAAGGGARAVGLRYLSRGFGWKADYVALFDEGAGKLDVQGWVTLTNTTGTGFANARVMLVAGQPSGDGDDGNAVVYPPQRRRPIGNRMGTGGEDGRETLGDFHVYPLAGRTTVANAQTKQVSFLNVAGVPAQKLYQYRNDWQHSAEEGESVDTVLAFTSAKDGGLGDALPAGTMRVYMRDARGNPQFVGESPLPHTPMGSDLALKTGTAFDVKVQPTVEKRERITGEEWQRVDQWRITRNAEAPVTYTVEAHPTYWRTQMAWKVTNARAVPVEVDVIQDGLDNGWHDTRVSAESQPGRQLSRDSRVWRVKVPARGAVTLTATIDTRY
ncbi:DUF4139 domain-containing protein [Novosphingobium sp. SG720]|uniref:DUF4139 domain-containing protein n=1 Tax=Novosphingobium sp. SG720 TaxID=2586998 RepID=UPI0017B57FE0|nr:DUF4139 domain-containing protein [Novosphingobium sp. SG720]NKJ42974.1 hypothetical protein [Novosphingobium sp. SG720]